ncbi:MAG: HD domain-containing protein [bacterium]
MEQLIKQTFKFVNDILKDDATGHDIEHIKRVFNIGSKIVEKIECDHLVVNLALILHDIDDPKITKNYNGDCVKARIYLSTLDIEKERSDHICDIINKMSFSKNKEEKQELTLEGKIVQDADRIDALGAVGIGRTFQYGGAKGRTMLNSLEHFDEKLLHLYDLLNTKEAKSIALERHNFLVDFYMQFKKEYFV